MRLPELKIFLACKFPPSEHAIRLAGLGQQLGLKISPADKPIPNEIMTKVRAQIYDADGVIFLYEELSEWLQAEYWLAAGWNKVIGIVHLKDTPLPALVSAGIGRLEIQGSPNDAPRIVKYLEEFMGAIIRANAALLDIESPTYVRRRLRHRLTIDRAGRLTYHTSVLVRSNVERLTDLTHSIHYNHNLCPPTDLSEEPKIETYSDGRRIITMKPEPGDPRGYSWLLRFDPALSYGEDFEYAFTARFKHYLPLTQNQLQSVAKTSDESLERIEHHYHISNPTLDLELIVDFEDGAVVADCEAVAYFGRTFSPRTFRPLESSKLQESLTVDEFSWNKRIRLSVTPPELGTSYGFFWSPRR